MKLKPITNFLLYLRYLYSIRDWLSADFKKKVNETQPPSLTQAQKDQIKEYWGDLYNSEAVYLSFYNLFTNSFDPRFLPENLYYYFLDPFLNNTNAAIVLDDKNLYDYLLHDIRRPKTIARIVHGELYDSAFQPLLVDDLLNNCANYDKVIIKPSILSCGGKGIKVFEKKDFTRSLRDLILNNQSYWCNVVIQEFIEQHTELSTLHPNSINTVRLLTLNWKGNVKVISSIVRMGIDDNVVDNISAGGIFVGLEESGRLKQYAYDLTGKRFEKHPQGAVFAQHCIPNYQELVKRCEFLTPRFASVSRLISWDFAIGKDGLPILIEVNLKCGEIDFHQIANGPILGDNAKDILEDVFSQKRNRLLRWWFDKIR